MRPDNHRNGLKWTVLRLPVTVFHKNDLAMSFGRFVKLAIPFTALQIALVKVYVPLVLR